MSQSRPKSPWALIVLLLPIGTAAAALALWLTDHRRAVPNSGIAIAFLMGINFVCFGWALIRFLRWRDLTRPVATVSTASSLQAAELAGTVYGLIPGAEYRVVKSFTDYYSNQFERGQFLRFKERHFLPYEGGHTIVFTDRSLYLQEERNSAILDNFSEYIERIER